MEDKKAKLLETLYNLGFSYDQVDTIEALIEIMIEEHKQADN